jgi:hypothetical protein
MQAVSRGDCRSRPVVTPRPPSPTPPMSETIHLSSEETGVPTELLDAPLQNDRRSVMLDLSAFLFDRHLRRLAVMRHPIELRLARSLGRLQASSGYLDLGFSRLSDYVTERLGISVRRAQDLLRIDRRLRELPLTSEAFALGRITQSQLRLLLRVVTPETECDWLGKAVRLNVRLLEREVRAARDAAPGSRDSEDAHARSMDSSSDEEAEPGCVVNFACPDGLRERWLWAIELCRRSAGAAEPVWRCAEYIAADFLSGVPDLPTVLARMCARGTQATERDTLLAQPCPRSSRDPDEDGIELFEEVLRRYEEGHGPRGLSASVSGPYVELPDSIRDDPADGAREIDRKLRALIALRQGLAWQQGRLLSTFVSLGLHRVLGFLSLGRYCKERLGLGIRRARQLISLDRRLVRLPDLEEAYRYGSVSWVKASAVARVADDVSERDWLRLAHSLTFRRLREEVALAEGRLEDPALRSGVPSGRRWQPPSVDPARGLGIESPWTRLEESPGSGASEVQTCAYRSAGSVSRVRFWAPEDVATLWRHAMNVCRVAAGRDLDDWECMAQMLDSFEQTWDVTRDPKWRRRYRIFQRDGWRCRVPGCSSRRNLQVHHVVYRSHGGGDEDDNLAVLCATHHLQGIHAGRLRCLGSADGFLRWDLGTTGGDAPLLAAIEDVLLAADGGGRATSRVVR